MRKTLCIIFSLLCLFILCSCGTNSASDNDNNDYQYDTTIISENKAKGLATEALYNKLKAYFLYVDDYDISQTRYTIASISGSGSTGYTVNGTYSLYDKYGNFKKRENFSVRVNSDGYATVTEY